jgi:hypothetical protein
LYTHVGGALTHALALGQFEHPEALRRLNEVFVDRYLTAFRAYRAGQPTTASWNAAFAATDRSRLCLLQHVILGINAHINLDLAIVTAEAIPVDELAALHADFNLVNEIIDFSTRIAREQAWNGAQRLARLSGAERDHAIAELDAATARLARAVADPPWHLGLLTFVIRLGERGTVTEMIDALLLMSSLKPR